MAAKLDDDTVKSARSLAERQVANRDRRDRLHRYWEALAAALDACLDVDGECEFAVIGGIEKPISKHADLLWHIMSRQMDLSYEIGRYEGEPTNIAAVRRPDGMHLVNTGKLDYSWQCALAGETADDATMRILLESGASSYQLGDGRVDGARRKKADRIKRRAAERLRADLEARPPLVLDRNGDHVTKSGRFTFRSSGPHAREQWRSDTTAKLERLTVDKKRGRKKNHRA